MAFKMDIYGSILCVFGVCIIENVENSTETNQPKGFSLVDLFEEKKAVDSKWRPIFYKLAEEIVRTITADVIFAPFALKVGFVFMFINFFISFYYQLLENSDVESLNLIQSVLDLGTPIQGCH